MQLYGAANIDGATFINNSSNGDGGAINGENSDNVTLTNCSFVGNSSGSYGGALAVGLAAGVSRCAFQNNVATGNGGAIASDGNLYVDDCLFNHNTVGGDGGAVYQGSASTGERALVNNTFVYNSSGSPTTGGAISSAGSMILGNDIIAFNSSGILATGLLETQSNNNCLYNNQYFDYSGVSPGSTDVSADPRFIDSSNGDFHVLSTSPCIDAGNLLYLTYLSPIPVADLDGNPRVMGSPLQVDIGCYEFTSLQTITGTVQLQGAVNAQQTLMFTFRPTVGSPSFPRFATLDASGNFTLTNLPPLPYTVAVVGPRYLQSDVTYTVYASGNAGLDASLLAGDINGDNLVDITDFSLLASAFGSDPASPYWNPYADLNNDGVVDISDFSLLAANFGLSGDP